MDLIIRTFEEQNQFLNNNNSIISLTTQSIKMEATLTLKLFLQSPSISSVKTSGIQRVLSEKKCRDPRMQAQLSKIARTRTLT